MEPWFSSKNCSIEDSSGCWNNLSSTSMNSISMERDILNVESNSSHIFFCHNTFFGCPLEGSFHRILDFMEVLNLFSLINKKIWSGSFWSKAPHFLSIIWIPIIFFLESFHSNLWIRSWSYFIIINSICELFMHWFTFHINSVMFIR